MLKAEGIGKNIEKAIEDALFQLRAPREDVDIKIIEEGGLFKKAKVLVQISEDVLPKYEKREQKPTETPVETKIETDTCKCCEPATQTCNCTCDETCTCGDECECGEECECHDECNCNKQDSNLVQNQNEKTDVAKKFVEKTLEHCHINANASVFGDDEIWVVNIESDKPADVIGRRGEFLNALQYLTQVVVDRADVVDKKSRRITLDTENYRARREESLKTLANRMAKKVLKSGRSIKLDPMPANERRIIHLEVQTYEGLETYSKGNEPHRYLIIKTKNSKED